MVSLMSASAINLIRARSNAKPIGSKCDTSLRNNAETRSFRLQPLVVNRRKRTIKSILKKLTNEGCFLFNIEVASR